MGDDRRRRERKQLRRVIKPLPLTFETDSVEGKGQVRSVSMAGMLVSCSSLPKNGELARIMFDDLEGSEVELCGTVMSTRPRQGQLARDELGFFMRIDADIDVYLEFYEQILTAG